MSKQKVAIIGAGLSGSMLAIYLAKRGVQIDVYEVRGDMRLQKMSAGRSINLALSNRGIAALKEVGLADYMLAEAVPMHGRMIHAVDGTTKFLPYSGRKGEFINSISRGGLNIALMNEAEKYDGVKFHFDARCTAFDCKSGVAKLENGESIEADTIFGTDGAGSVIRNAMMNETARFNYSIKWLEHGYKELTIPPKNLSSDDRFLIERNVLHIWARRSFMMIALPNFDGSFTVTLFLAHTGGNATTRERASALEIDTLANARVSAFDGLSDEDSLKNFFQTHFPDAIELIPDLPEQFFANPTGNLGTVKCSPWNVGGKSLLIGDAAHAVVPFYGQGMNASFEDCRVLNQLLDAHGFDWETVFDEFTRVRKPNADAIADMAEENFFEMRDAVADPVFQRKRELEMKLEQKFPDYFSKYSMVTFREDLPYSVAKGKGNAQDRFLMEMCREIDSVGELNIEEVFAALKAECC